MITTIPTAAAFAAWRTAGSARENAERQEHEAQECARPGSGPAAGAMEQHTKRLNDRAGSARTHGCQAAWRAPAILDRPEQTHQTHHTHHAAHRPVAEARHA